MRNLFSTRVKVILVIAALLTVGLSILSGITNTTVVDLAVGGVLAPFRAAATVSLPGIRRIGEIDTTTPILLATLEAVNESLWGILLNFSNQVSSDLMPPV